MKAPALLAALFLGGCSSLPARPAGRAVVVEGWAALGEDGRAEARRRAVADALRRAVEESAGVEIAASTVVENAAAARSSVRATARGRVRRSEVLEEGESEGLLKVRIRAVVSAVDASGPGRAYLAGGADAAWGRAWTAGGGELAASAEEADVILRGAFTVRDVDEPRVRPYVSVRARAELTLERPGGERRTAAREASALGLDLREARGAALDASALAAVRALSSGR